MTQKTGWKFASVAKVVAGLSAALLLQACIVSDGLESTNSQSHTSSWVRGDNPQEKIGQREHPVVVAKYGGEYKNSEVEKLLAIVTGRLIAVSDDKSSTYKITILNSPKVNAFALPGGYLYLTRGLLALANDTAEIAAVIAHEMAHVSANHAILRNEKKSSDEVGSEVVSEVLGGSVAGQVALAANEIRLSDFSKDQELQADALGIRMLGQAGFDAHAAANFLITMQSYRALSNDGGSKFSDNSFLSSHPTTPQRIELAKRHARMFGAPGSGEADRTRYLRGVDGVLYGDSVEEGFVRANRFSHSGLGITFSAPENARLENQATAVLVSGPSGLATRFDAAVLPRGQNLETYIKSGWVKGLDKKSVTTSEQNGYRIARADAYGGEWHFVVRLIQLNRQVYRFITAGPKNSLQSETVSNQIAGSFRKLTEAEKADLQPLRIKVVTVSHTDTLATLSSRMKGGKNGLKLFQVLNGLNSGELPQPGTRVNLVSD